MISRLHPKFRRGFDALPPNVRERARDSFRRFLADPSHSSLAFKRVDAGREWWSVRISLGYRAVGVRGPVDVIVWFFIGTHAEYDRLL